MNERITELMIQAISDVDSIDDPETRRMYIPDCFAEKFAELIVRECGIALSPMLRDMISRGQAYDIIKEHFGVDTGIEK
jgi:hypothetical protein